MTDMTPGRFARECREARGWSRDQLAARAAVSVSTVARFELYGQLPNARALLRLADQLDTSLDALVGHEQPGQPEPELDEETSVGSAAACESLGIDLPTLHQWVRWGHIRPITTRDGGDYLFDNAEVERLLIQRAGAAL